MGTTSTRAAAFLKLVLVTLCLTLQQKLVVGEDYVVGANFVGALWTNDPGPSNSNLTLIEQYEEWAKSVKIAVGDTLQFFYDDSHTVVLVPTQQMYDSCNYLGSKDVTSGTPPTLYNVTSTEPLYFVCSVDKHCAEGQKVAVTNILPASSTPAPLMKSAGPPGHSYGGLFLRPASKLRSYLSLGSFFLLFFLIIS